LNFPTNPKSALYQANSIFSFPALLQEHAYKIIEECINFSGSNLPIVTPNPFSLINDEDSCILNEFMKEEITPFIKSLTKLVCDLYPEYGLLSDSDFMAFFVKNEEGNHSTYHVDESHITVAICLSEDFEGGELVFNVSSKDIEVSQKPFYAIVFPGCIPHYTKPTTGKRYNLIIYLKQDKCDKTNDFYDTEYVEYLSLVGIRNVSIEEKQTIAFTVPSVGRPEEGLYINSFSLLGNEENKIKKKLPVGIYENIFEFLNSQELSEIELVCKVFLQISRNIWKQKYLKVKGEIEKMQNVKNYKTLYQSMEVSKNRVNSGKSIMTIHIDDVIGEEFLKHMSSMSFIQDHMCRHSNPNDPVNPLFSEVHPGYFEPRSIFINSSNSISSQFLNNNCNKSNLFYINSLNSEKTYDSGFETNLQDFFDQLRKMKESHDYFSRLIVTCDSTPFSVGLSNSIKEHIVTYYSKSEVTLAPLIHDYNIYTGILVNEWCKDFPVMQYEAGKIKETLEKFCVPDQFKKPECLIARAIYGLTTFEITKLSEMIMNPGITLIQQSMSPIFSEKLHLREMTENTILSPVLHHRLEEKIKTFVISLNFMGEIAPKDIMSAIGDLRCRIKNYFEFVDWASCGFRSEIKYKKELIFGNYASKSVHSFANTSDSLNFFKSLKDCITNETHDIININYEDVLENIENTINNYVEIYTEHIEEDLE